jgi:hypothetical protein
MYRKLQTDQEKHLSMATLGRGVELKASEIPGAGRGLFATRPFATGYPVTCYEGEHLSRIEVDAMDIGKQTHVRVVAAHHAYIDGRLNPVRDGLGGASWANDRSYYKARDGTWTKRKGEGGMNNTKYDIWNNELRIVATRPIAIGDEITTSYGSTYWTRANDEIQVRVERKKERARRARRTRRPRRTRRATSAERPERMFN